MVFDSNGKIIRKSKNLRGMLDYARVSKVAKIQAKKHGYKSGRGVLTVTYCNGATSIAEFACYGVLLDFIKARKAWHNSCTAILID